MRVGGLVGAVLLSLLAGCAMLRNDADDYRQARNLPPLALPADAETRPIAPLYPIPPGPVPTEWPEKFKAPAPAPLVLDRLAAEPAPATTVAASASRPVLTQDGNGYPLVTISGDFNLIWDRLAEALRQASAKVEDRDQRVGLYYLRLDDESGKNTPYQLRITRGQSAYTLTLQQDDDTLAPRATSRALLEAIVRHWPEPATPQ